MPAKAGPSLRVPGGRRPDPPRPHCLLPHWRPQTWDFPDENTNGPFILSFSPIICTHSFTHQTTSPFRSCAPEAFPAQWERQSLSQEPLPGPGSARRHPGAVGDPRRWVGHPMGDSEGPGGCATHWILKLSPKERQECVSEVKSGGLLALQVPCLKGGP